MKIVATGFLVVAGLVYLVAEYALHNGAEAWVGYVRAAAEAGMVGGLADWFAVTALFRHPLGIPIPHTALIRKKKDQLGESLGGFVGEGAYVDRDFNTVDICLIMDTGRMTERYRAFYERGWKKP